MRFKKGHIPHNKLDLNLEEIKERYLNNETIKSIAKSYGVSTTSISDRLKMMNVKKIGMKNKYEIHGDTTTIYLRKRNGELNKTIINTDDLELANSITGFWFVASYNGVPYVRADIKSPQRKSIFLHRLVTNAPEGKVVDHINHDTLDNRKENLRIVDISDNIQNLKGARKDSSSGYRGVLWSSQKKKWQATLCVKGKRYHLGFFSDKEEANKIVSEARARLMPYSPESHNKKDWV